MTVLARRDLLLNTYGNLYGVTNGRGNKNSNCNSGCGVVFQLAP